MFRLQLKTLGSSFERHCNVIDYATYTQRIKFLRFD